MLDPRLLRARAHRRCLKRHSAPLRQLERLEVRTLLSAVIQLSGNGTGITSGDTTPGVTDFTDFGYMSTTASGAIGSVTRTYTIGDGGDADLNLTGVPRVQITGANAGDFVVTVGPGVAVAAGGETTFTVAFVPTAAGLRKGTVTIQSDDPATGAFTFDIQGTGVTTTNSGNGLQVATITAGTGAGAVATSVLAVSYTGYLTTGSIFDATVNHGGTPFSVTLGNNEVIQGWEQGLVGMKLGETRVLLIPAALGYGSQARTGIPANSPLIFEVTDVTLVLPTVVVSGNDVVIGYGDTTPSAADGTDLGTTAAGDKTPRTMTFKVANGTSVGVSLSQVPAVTLTGSGTTNFATTDITVSTGNNYATFTVTYTPTTAGTQTASVHVLTSDAGHPDFAFDVAGTYTPTVAPVLKVSGGGVVIANNDATPSIADFTDFGPTSMTYNASIGRVSRTFLIANAGDPALTLTGTPTVKVTGANAADFVLGVAPAPSIGANLQTSFTLVFVPKGTGVRKATVTILTNDPAAPTFTYQVQATAYATTNSANGLQVATITKGIGAAMVTGWGLTANYTGFLLTKEFESSLDAGGTPIDFTLGQSGLIDGWTQGLVGIKQGETRLLVMPQKLGYDTNSHGNVPANSPLIFTVTATAVRPPVVDISGNGVSIVYNEKTPNGTDGTLIGATVAGSSAPLTFTYHLTNSGGGSLSFAPTVVVQPKAGAQFTSSDIAVDSGGGFAYFTVTYTPTKPGTQSAVITVQTTDPIHPTFTFTVAGVYTPFVDLKAVSIGTINYPVSANIVSGAATQYTIPVMVTNLGNVGVAGNSPAVNFNVYLHDTTTNTDTLIGTKARMDLRGLGAGQTRSVKLAVAVPITVPTHLYEVRVKMNEEQNPLLPETNYSNNSALSSQVVNITQGYYNVDGVLGASTFPVSIAAGLTLTGKLTTLVRNVGNLALPTGQKYVLQTVAHNSDTNADLVIGTSTLTLSAWAAGKTASFTVSTSLLGGVTAGHFEIRALLTPVGVLAESSSADNVVRLNGAGSDVGLTVG